MSNKPMNFDAIDILPENDASQHIGDATHKWNIVSPILSGTPTAPTASVGTNTTQVATTAFVKNAVDAKTGSFTWGDLYTVTG